MKGIVLISTFLLLVTLTAVAVGFLYMNSTQTIARGHDIVSSKALWLAEAGLQKAIWNLKTPTGGGGQGENWTTTGVTESLGGGSYTMAVARYDFALSANGVSASDSPAQSNASIGPSKAIDGSDSTHWESAGAPSNTNPQNLIIAFPYPLTVNKVRFLAPSSATLPRNYTWAVSSDGSAYTPVVTVNNNSATDRTDTFSGQSNVNYLRLRVTQDGSGNPQRVRIATLEAIGSKVTATGTLDSFHRKIQQTVVTDDGSPQNQVAYDQIDWTEIIPA